MNELKQDFINLLEKDETYIEYLNGKKQWHSKCMDYLKSKLISLKELYFLTDDNANGFQNIIMTQWWNLWKSHYPLVSKTITREDFKNKYIKSNYFNSLNDIKRTEMLSILMENKIISKEECIKIYENYEIK
ncbi:hypothetical protein [Spiroplasma phoeniceum]|uniref:Uncharacterized protein n=1 Tax=Spiroplasma phoeniceum P40 TaxID=1276259 RepID=A0A345DP09_9MOLU|nr:hypothetical protein [Spiroplasma phoeniceum]AXF95947.1 hypothetical protein SDAV_00967 [Spiroplasma phoeniceum P40]